MTIYIETKYDIGDDVKIEIEGECGIIETVHGKISSIQFILENNFENII